MYRNCMKRVLDFCLSLIGIVILAPLLILIAVLVRVNLGAPVLFKQQRVGKDEKIFTMMKFRTMSDRRDDNGELLPPQREDGTTDFSRLSMQIPSGLVPCCPVCGEPMGMNLRADETFVEDEGWHAASAAYARFLKKHEKGRVLYLELGVGTNTPVIIKYPFWQMTADNPDAVYACINLGEAYAPAEIAARSVCIDGDLGEVIGRSLSVK